MIKFMNNSPGLWFYFGNNFENSLNKYINISFQESMSITSVAYPKAWVASLKKHLTDLSI